MPFHSASCIFSHYRRGRADYSHFFRFRRGLV
jgi:hypothetical protein